MNWRYEEVKPEVKLSEVIECYWWEDYCRKNPDLTHHIVPDNSIELIFIRTPFHRVSPEFNRQWLVQSHLCGLKTRSQLCRVKDSPIISVRFKPKGLYLFTKISPKTTVDNCLELSNCFGRSILKLEEQLFETENQERRIELLNEFFESLYLQNEHKRDLLFEAIAEEIESKFGSASIEELSEKFGISTKTIQRRFLEHMGITPKKYSRLIRVINCLRQSKRKKQLTQLAYESEYFDQSHFVKDIKSIIRCTPSHFSKSDKGIQAPTF